MNKKLFIVAAIALFAVAQSAKAQTNLQVFYDFGSDRQHVTTTLEGFYGDKWGNTFFFIDYDYNNKDADKKNVSPSGTYFELARCFNFWQESKLAPLSLQVEYNGGAYVGYGINHAFLLGVDWFIHSKDFSNTLNLKVLYKNIIGKTSKAPLQFTAVWGMQDIFGVKGLRFSGFADFWWEDHNVCPVVDGVPDITQFSAASVVFLSEPQLWYNVGQHFGVDNLNIGGEAEISVNFATGKGFFLRPCAGLKWVF